MARQRRGGGFGSSSGFKPPELRGTLGTLLRTAAAQVAPLREALGDALERTAREGRSRVSDAISSARSGRSGRAPVGGARRADALAELGEVVLDLIRQGEIDIDQLPEVHDIVAHLDELDEGHGHSQSQSHSHSHSHGGPSHSHSHPHDEGDDHEHDQSFAAPPSRSRFDARGRDKGPGRNAPPRGAPAGADDGTVSSRTWAPPNRGAKPASPAASPPRVWRPPVDEDDAADVTARERPAAPRPERHVPLPKDPLRKGGISFDDDEDLAEYMHPDDVPPKGGSDGDA